MRKNDLVIRMLLTGGQIDWLIPAFNQTSILIALKQAVKNTD
jgi:hypothetical protein